MAARLWRCIIGFALALAAASGALLSGAFHWPLPAAVSIAFAMLFAMPAACVFASFAAASAAPRNSPERWDIREIWRALLSEIAGFTTAVLAMSAADVPRRRATPPPAALPPRPVLLLHGFLCNGRVWSALQGRLQSAGFGPVEAPDVVPLLADIETQAGRVAPVLLALQARCGGERVVIIAHSMGGLIARVLLRDFGAGVIRRIVTIASPHHGTLLARGLPWPNAAQISDASPWLRTLNSAQEGRFTVPMSSVYSRQDNLVVPPLSACLQGAELKELRGIGHLAMLRSRRALDCVMASLLPDTLG
ncbi:MAG: alpha/beta fold hydrolase [Steroidobacteraceae bacterium]